MSNKTDLDDMESSGSSVTGNAYTSQNHENDTGYQFLLTKQTAELDTD